MAAKTQFVDLEMQKIFTGSFTQQLPIPEAAIEAAVKVMRHGRLHRYNVEEGELSEAALLEQEFAKITGVKFCLACASCGYALATALRAVEVMPGDVVLTNAFTLAPVPGAISSIGAKPVFVEITQDLVLDIEDLRRKIEATNTKFLLVSHMRGHSVDMDKVMNVCDAASVVVIEDCAHTMGASWRDIVSGRHGVVGCYSTQTFKHVNSGEGGLLVTDDPEIMARATMLSGSYMLYGRHGAGAPDEVFDSIRLDTPNCSGRMDNLRAAILRPQLADLDRACADWNERYQLVESNMRNTPGLQIIERPKEETFVGSSIQFRLPDFSAAQMTVLLDAALARGVELKWFGADEPSGFTSRHNSWRYVSPQHLPNTDRVLSTLIDMRLPLTFSLDECALIAEILREEVISVWTG